MSSPINQLADQLPNLLIQVAEMRQRQDTQASLNEYRTAVLSQSIRANDLKQEAQAETRALQATKRGQARRTDMLKLEDEREGGAAAVFGNDQVDRDFPFGIPASRKQTETLGAEQDARTLRETAAQQQQEIEIRKEAAKKEKAFTTQEMRDTRKVFDSAQRQVDAANLKLGSGFIPDPEKTRALLKTEEARKNTAAEKLIGLGAPDPRLGGAPPETAAPAPPVNDTSQVEQRDKLLEISQSLFQTDTPTDEQLDAILIEAQKQGIVIQ